MKENNIDKNKNNKKTFEKLGLAETVLSAIAELGYEAATPIQEQGIPIFLQGKNLLAQAQTGTGKTATFALPILSRLTASVRAPQALILVPTRELAIQVAQAFESYAIHIKGFTVTPIYGGQDMRVQLRALKQGSQVIVGTPGRLMDHMRRGTLFLDHLKTVVLDEADEMLKMGFAEDVEWILGQLTQSHQTALFSATMSPGIQKIAQRYLKEAEKIRIQSTTNTVEAIEQSYIVVSNREQKMAVLTRLLECEDNQSVIIFTRTKTESMELAEKLQARGHSAAALNGDMSQQAREKTISRLRKGDLTILIATDVAARGIDVEHITHVINYDIPYDVDSYVHRIGRTGRAGRTGKAILFVTSREMRLLRDIERHINKPIKRIEPPSLKDIIEKRSAVLAEKIVEVIHKREKQLLPYLDSVMKLTHDASLSVKDVAAALMLLHQEKNGVVDVLEEKPRENEKRHHDSHRGRHSRGNGERGRERSRDGDRDRRFSKDKPNFRKRFHDEESDKTGKKDKKEHKKEYKKEGSDNTDRNKGKRKERDFDKKKSFKHR